ncbi:MFS transporter [Paenibacillus sp. J45TS6]|uniref:MFS transporter n=1 Tax=Paenibacillus sp. J45TS6 TaxID=2807196 RepID=UPI001B2B45C9|nr:MFS transporter [Paenibacillus sp. J45TS6]GIP43894.1 MFS transporter [Paenibacillus sp. J45TS6]
MNLYAFKKRHAHFLLTSIGISHIGDWIYLIAINLMILHMTESPAAVGLLYILRPIATMITAGFAGSLVDRWNTRNMMIWLDLFRAVLILAVPFLPSLPLIYIFVFLISMASSLFEPASLAFTVSLIPTALRKKYNAWVSLTQSGAYVIGPAAAGGLFAISSSKTAIMVNGISFLLSALLLTGLPSMGSASTLAQEEAEQSRGPISKKWRMLKKDWWVVWHFSKTHVKVIMIYGLFHGIMIMAAALDSLEVSFITQVIHSSDSQYSMLLSITGISFLLGSFIQTRMVDRLHTMLLLGYGALLFSTGYVVYSFSHHLVVAGMGFVILSFFQAFMNTGYYTYIQNEIPVSMIGRVTSVYSLIQSFLEMIMIWLISRFAEFQDVKSAVVSASLLQWMVAIVLLVYCIYFMLLERRKVDSTSRVIQ